MGVDVPEDYFYTSAMATASFLKVQRPNGCSVFPWKAESGHDVLGTEEIRGPFGKLFYDW
jgi:ribonucleotide monophosphatase NagD (HAD superfamily)